VIMQESKQDKDIYFGNETFQCVQSTDMPGDIVGIVSNIRGSCSGEQCKSDVIVRSPVELR
jgi:hypothetical protein